VRRPFGTTGLEIAPLALGAMNLGLVTPPDESAVMLDRAIDAGITLVDIADVYRDSDQIVGDAWRPAAGATT
jgi:aryl-alcohol dehydrogenase-like predicted oxidoreductase